jgi:hypothetical protein
MGMLVIGSTISPLMFISISTLGSDLPARNIGTMETTVNESLAEAAPGARSARPP